MGRRRGGGVVEWWSGGVVEWWSGGAVERWSGGAVERWSGGAVERWSCFSDHDQSTITPRTEEERTSNHADTFCLRRNADTFCPGLYALPTHASKADRSSADRTGLLR